jgi:hypothetical protein
VVSLYVEQASHMQVSVGSVQLESAPMRKTRRNQEAMEAESVMLPYCRLTIIPIPYASPRLLYAMILKCWASLSPSIF